MEKALFTVAPFLRKSVVIDPFDKSKIWFNLVWFYGISIIVGYSMPNPLYTYISNV